NPLRACAAPQRPLLPCTRTTSESPHACGPLLGPPFHVEHSQDPFHACGALLGPLRACAALLGSFPACGALPGPPPMPVGRWGPSMHVEYAWGPLPCMWSTPGPPPPLAGEGRGGDTGAPTAGPRYSRSSRAQTPPPSTFTGNFATGS